MGLHRIFSMAQVCERTGICRFWFSGKIGKIFMAVGMGLLSVWPAFAQQLSIDKTVFNPDPGNDKVYHTAQGIFTYAVPAGKAATLVINCNGTLLSRVALLSDQTTYRRSFLHGGDYEAYLEIDGQRQASTVVNFKVNARWQALEALRFIRQQLVDAPDYIDIGQFKVPTTGSDAALLRENMHFLIGGASLESKDGYYTRANLSYSVGKTAYKAFYAYIDNVVKTVLPADATDMQKAALLYGYIVSYANSRYIMETSHPADAFGAAWNRETVCDGYSRFVYVLADLAGLNCVKGGSGDIAHAWNVVEIDGEWYQVDATWEGDASWRRGASFGWFGHSDESFIENHTTKHEEKTWSCSGVQFPDCNSKRFEDHRSDYIFTRATNNYFLAPGGGFYFTENGNTVYTDFDGSNKKTIKTGQEALDWMISQTPVCRKAWLVTSVEDGEVETGTTIAFSAGLPYHTKVRVNDLGYEPEIVYTIYRNNQPVAEVQGAAFTVSTYTVSEPGSYRVEVGIKANGGQSITAEETFDAVDEFTYQDVTLDIAQSDIRISSRGYEYKGVFHKGRYAYTITGSSDRNRIDIKTMDKVRVTLDGVHADLSSAPSAVCPLQIGSVSDISITLKGENVFKGKDRAGVNYDGEGRLSVSGDGTLETHGGYAWPGLYIRRGTLTLDAAAVVAYGGQNASGIGSSWGVSCSAQVVIQSGCITAVGSNGAGIGAGFDAEFTGTVEINGGSVKASGSYAFGGGSGKSEVQAVNAAGKVLTLNRRARYMVTSLEVEGKPYSLPLQRHPGDGSFYIWLPSEGNGKLNGDIDFELKDGIPTIETSADRVRLDIALSSIEIDASGYTYNNVRYDGKFRYTVFGTTNSNYIRAVSMDSLELELDNVTIDLRTLGTATAPLRFESVSVANLFVSGNNELRGKDRPAMWQLNAGLLNLDGDGRCELYGGVSWPGMRVLDKNNTVINGGEWYAVGGSNAAGIGGSWGTSISGKLEINGGYIHAQGGVNGAGIGGGRSIAFGTDVELIINGGCVMAQAGTGSAAGIGNGNTDVECKGKVIINGGSVKAAGSNPIGGSSKALQPVNANGTPLVLNKIPASMALSLIIEGKPYPLPEYRHENDPLYYLYLPQTGDGQLNGDTDFELADGLPDIRLPKASVELDIARSSVEIGLGYYVYDGKTTYGFFNYTIFGKTSSNTIDIQGVSPWYLGMDTLNLVLRDIEIDLSAGTETCPLAVADARLVNLSFEGNNVLKAAESRPGIWQKANSGMILNGAGTGSFEGGTSCSALQMEDSDTTRIKSGSFVFKGGQFGAGIGGGNNQAFVGVVIIDEGHVTATGGMFGSGIGAGVNGTFSGTVIINGGCITAQGDNGAGIGGGASGIFDPASGRIEINGGSVKSTGGSHGNAFGGGANNPATIPVNASGDPLKLNIVNRYRLADLTVKGEPYPVPFGMYHEENDENFYFYWPETGTGNVAGNDFDLADGFPGENTDILHYLFYIDGLFYRDMGNAEACVTTPMDRAPWYNSVVTFPTGDIVVPSTVRYRGTTYTVKGIDDHALAANEFITSVSLPATLDSIGYAAMTGSPNMAEIKIDTANTRYHVEQGALFDADRTVLIQYPTARKGGFTLPLSVRKINPGAVTGCTGMTEFVSLAPIPAEAATDEFKNMFTCNLVTSCDGSEAYRMADGWKNFKLFESRFYGYTLEVASTDETRGKAEVKAMPRNCQDSAVAEAMPEPGYLFACWSDSATENPYHIALRSDVRLEAWFAPPTYTVHFDANGGTGAMSSFDMEFGVPKNLPELTFASTDPHYFFAGWSLTSGGKPVYADQEEAVDINRYAAYAEEITLYAIWEKEKRNLVLTTEGTGSGQAEGAGRFYIDSVVEIRAIPDAGSLFVSWKDGYLEPVRQIRMERDTALTAIFIPALAQDPTDSYYLIYSKEELIGFAGMVSNGQAGSDARLMADIDLSDTRWIPIGRNTGASASKSYQGHFDGNRHVLSNLKFEWAETEPCGFFGRIEGGRVSDLGFESAQVTSTAGAVTGILAGELSSADIENCYVRGGVMTGSSQKGGIAGRATASNLHFCYTDLETLAGGASIDHSYSLSSTDPNGKPEAAFASGEVTVLLGTAYGQRLGTDDFPVFADGTNAVYPIRIYCGDRLCHETYGNTGYVFTWQLQPDWLPADIRFIRWSEGDLGNNLEGRLTVGNQPIEITAIVTLDVPMPGEGSVDVPFEIRTREDMESLNTMIDYNGVNYTKGAHFRLMNDIDLSEGDIDWRPVGTSVNPFKGYFHGGGHSLRLKIESGGIDYIGLFGYMESAYADSLFLFGRINLASANHVGALAGGAKETELRAIANLVDVNANAYVGGIVGEIWPVGRISDCQNFGKIEGGAYVGGIVGEMNTVKTQASDLVVEKTVNYGDILARSNIGSVGGIAGKTFNCYTAIYKSLNFGKVTASLSPKAGAIVSHMEVADGWQPGGTVNYVEDCFYDVQWGTKGLKGLYSGDVAGRMTGLSTRGMLGDQLKSLLGDGFVYAEGMYPRLKAFAEDSATILYSVAYPLYVSATDAAQYDHATEFVHAAAPVSRSGNFRFEWRSRQENVDFTNPDSPKFTGFGLDTLVVSRGGLQRLLPVKLGYDLQIDGDDFVKGHVEKLGTTMQDSTLVLTATGDNGFVFSKWQDGVFDSVRNVENISSDIRLGVIFDFAVGDGSESNPYLIYTVEQMRTLAQEVNKNSAFADGKHFKLMNDLDLSEGGTKTSWTPIGREGSRFKGYFHGEGYTVHMEVNGLPSENYGLFGCAEHALIEKIAVSGFIENRGTARHHTGAIVGRAYNSTRISQCMNFADIATDKSNSIAGIVGRVDNGTVEDCVNFGSVTSTGVDVSGLVGYFAGNCTFRRGFSNAAVLRGSGGTDQHVSHVIGEYRAQGSSSTIENGFYDKQWSDPKYRAINTETDNESVGGKATRDMTGEALKDKLGENFVYAEGMYPRLKAFADDSLTILYSAAYPLYASATEADDYDHATRFVHAAAPVSQYGTYRFEWESIGSKVDFSNPDRPVFKQIGAETLRVRLGSLTRERSVNLGYTVTAEVNNPSRGHTIVQGVAMHDSVMTLTAVASPGWYFSEWSDHKGDSVRSDTLRGDLRVRAIFGVLPGNGSETHPYRIYTVEQLKYVASETNKDQNFSAGKHFVLMNDLDLSEGGTTSAWTQIGSFNEGGTARSFKGYFHGEGHTVHMNVRTTEARYGLFGYALDAVIENLAVSGSIENTRNEAHDMAGIVGRIRQSKVSNCMNFARIVAAGSNSIAGIVGRAEVSTIEDCVNFGSIISQGVDIGGIVGCLADASTFRRGFSNTVELQGSPKNGRGVAHLAGDYLNENGAPNTVENGFYDKQWSDPNWKAVFAQDDNESMGGRLTREMTGENLKDKLGANFVYAEGMYPRLKAFADDSLTILYSAAYPLYASATEADDYDHATRFVHAAAPVSRYDAYRFEWESAGGKVDFSNPDRPVFEQIGAETLRVRLGTQTREMSVNLGYTVTAEVNDPSRGHTIVQGVAMHDSVMTLTAVASPGWYFSEWSDHRGDSVRSDTLRGDLSVRAIFGELPGNGSEAYPYRIYTVKQMEYVAAETNKSTAFANGKHFKLMNDLDLTEGMRVNWIPIGTSSRPFGGYFHGGMHTIRYTIDRPSSNYQGLFGYIANAMIDSLGTEGSIAGAEYTGGLVGYCTGDRSRISVIRNRADVKGSGYVGGVIGCLEYSGAVSHCVNMGLIRSRQIVGGVVGEFKQFRGSQAIEYLVNYGTVIGEENGVGGVLGKTYMAPEGLSLSKSLNFGMVQTGSGNLLEIGSIMGFIDRGKTSLASCFYDKQWSRKGLGAVAKADLPGQAEGKLTREMTGEALKDVLGDGFVYVEGLYPRLKAFADDSLTILYSAGYPLYDNPADAGQYDNRMDFVHAAAPVFVSGDGNSFAWESQNRMIDFSDPARILFQSVGADTLWVSFGKYRHALPVHLGYDVSSVCDPIYGSVADTGVAMHDSTVTFTFTFAEGAEEEYRWVGWKGIGGSNPVSIKLQSDTVLYPLFVPNPFELEGEGTAQDPFRLYTRADFDYLREIVSYTDGVHFRLMNDVDLSGDGRDWRPVGTETEPFRGIFDGDGHTVNLNFRGYYGDNFGIFGYTRQAVIEDLAVTGYISNRGHHTAAVAGRITDGTRISRCVNMAWVDGYSSNSVGGIVGRADASKIEDCMNFGSVSSRGIDVGGIVGYTLSGTLARNFSVAATLSGNGNVGQIVGSDNRSVVENSFYDKQWSDPAPKALGSGERIDVCGKTTLGLLGDALENNLGDVWVYTENLYPRLKTFADDTLLLLHASPLLLYADEASGDYDNAALIRHDSLRKLSTYGGFDLHFASRQGRMVFGDGEDIEFVANGKDSLAVSLGKYTVFREVWIGYTCTVYHYGGTLRQEGLMFPGDTVRLTVSPKPGFVFEKWTDDQMNEISRELTCQFEVTGDITLHALFSPEALPQEAYRSIELPYFSENEIPVPDSMWMYPFLDPEMALSPCYAYRFEVTEETYIRTWSDGNGRLYLSDTSNPSYGYWNYERIGKGYDMQRLTAGTYYVFRFFDRDTSACTWALNNDVTVLTADTIGDIVAKMPLLNPDTVVTGLRDYRSPLLYDEMDENSVSAAYRMAVIKDSVYTLKTRLFTSESEDYMRSWLYVLDENLNMIGEHDGGEMGSMTFTASFTGEVDLWLFGYVRHSAEVYYELHVERYDAEGGRDVLTLPELLQKTDLHIASLPFEEQILFSKETTPLVYGSSRYSFRSEGDIYPAYAYKIEADTSVRHASLGFLEEDAYLYLYKKNRVTEEVLFVMYNDDSYGERWSENGRDSYFEFVAEDSACDYYIVATTYSRIENISSDSWLASLSVWNGEKSDKPGDTTQYFIPRIERLQGEQDFAFIGRNAGSEEIRNALAGWSILGFDQEENAYALRNAPVYWTVSGNSDAAVFVPGEKSACYEFAPDLALRIKLVYEKYALHYYVEDMAAGCDSVAYGAEIALRPPEEKEGYTFSGWQIEENVVRMPDHDLNACGRFTANTYTVVFEANGGEGTMPDQEFVYDREDRLALCTLSRPGYAFVGWSLTLEGEVLYPDAAWVRNLTPESEGKIRLYAVWDILSYRVSARPGHPNYGEVLIDGDVPNADGTYNYGSRLTLSARTFDGFRFTGWSDGEKEAVRTLQVVSDTSVIAEYATVKVYRVAFRLNNDTMGSVSVSGAEPAAGEDYYYEGSVLTLTLKTADHHWVQWEDGSSTPVRTWTVRQDTIFKLRFGIDTYWVDFSVDDARKGYVECRTMPNEDGSFDYGCTVEVGAVAYPGYRFAYWTDGVGDAERRILVTGDAQYRAVFEENVGNEDVETEGDFVVVGGMHVIYIFRTDKEAEVYDLTGRRIYSGRDREIPVGQSGMYMVSIDGRVKKVIVR